MARSHNYGSNAGPTARIPVISREVALSRLRRLLGQIPEVQSKGRKSGFLAAWHQNLEGVIHSYFGPDSLQFEHFKKRDLSQGFYQYIVEEDKKEKRKFDQGVELAGLYVQSRITELDEEDQEVEPLPKKLDATRQKSSRKVFVVHGHDHGSKETVARFLSQLELVPIILHEQPDQGRTIIEKFEDNADVACAVVILSPDDIASSKSNPTIQEQRARQNVIFELGFFVGKLSRKQTFALLFHGVTKPSDIDGVLYISMDDNAWKLRLVRELQAAGIDVDANKAI
jgi:predicted nucleotide-binding protein